MSLITIALLFLAGFMSGAINAVAGGGTFISFGALSLIGVPPISASSISVCHSRSPSTLSGCVECRAGLVRCEES